MTPTLDDLRHAARTIGAETGCRLIVLHGSTARRAKGTHDGDRGPGDVDLAVLPDPDANRLDPVDLTNRFIRELGVQAIDITGLLHADPLTMMLVAREGIPIFENPPGEFGKFHSLAVRRYADTRKFREMEHERLREFVERREARP